jgi:hypothetical protein
MGFLSGLLVVLCLLGEASSWLHLVIVRHVVCADHGQLVDVAAGTEHALELTTPREPREGDGVERSDAFGVAAHGDHHCEFLATLRTRVPVPSAGVEPIPRVSEPLPAPAPALSAGSSFPLLLLAPKASPPVRAA